MGASEALSGLGRLCGGARRVGKHSRVHSRRKRTLEGPGGEGKNINGLSVGVS